MGVVAVLGGGCANKKAEAVAELGKIDAACAKPDPDGARQLMRDAAAKNPLFREALDAAKANWNVTDDAKMNPCGIFLADLKKRLAH